MDMSTENNNKNTYTEGSKVPFEIALNKAGFGLYSLLLTALNGLSIIAFACIVYSSTIIVQTSACELNTTTAQQGILVAAPIVSSVFGSILWGYLADNHGRRLMLLASYLAATIFNSIASMSVNWIMLMLLQVIASFMAAGQYSITMTLVSECVPAVRRNLVVLIVASIFLLSQGVMAVFAIPIVPLKFSIYLPALGIYWNSWRTTLLLYGLPSVICFIWMFFMQESPKFVFVKKGEAEALEILKRIHRINHLNSKEELQVKGLLSDNLDGVKIEDKSKSRVGELFKGKLLKYLIIMTVLAMCQQVGTFLVWLPTITDQFVEALRTGNVQGLSLCSILRIEDTANTDCSLHETSLLIVFGIASLTSIFNLFMVLLVGKFGRRNMVMMLTSVCGASGIIVNLIPNAIGSVIFFIIFLMGFVVVGLYSAIAVALFPTHLRALAIATMMAGGRIALFATAQIMKILLKNNCALSFYLFASIFAASAVVVSFLPDERFVKKEDEEKLNVEIAAGVET